MQAAHNRLGSGLRASFSWDKDEGPPDTWTAPIAFGSAPVPAGVPPMELEAAKAEASSSAPDALHPWPQVSPGSCFSSWHAHPWSSCWWVQARHCSVEAAHEAL